MASVGDLPFLALRLEREVDHHDGVLLHDADQQDDPDQSHHAEFGMKDHQGQNRSDACGRERRQNRERMNVALVEHAQDDVHGHHRRQN